MLRPAASVLASAIPLALLAGVQIAPDRLRAGGTFSVPAAGSQSYSQPGPALDPEQQARFAAGRTGFHQRWVVKPSILGLWGRGPTSNGEVCTDCHDNNGRGRPPLTSDEPLRSMIVRLSIPGRNAHGGPAPHPVYGEQLQFQGVLGVVPGEGEAYLRWHETTVHLAGGEQVRLRAPAVEFRDLHFGPIEADTLLSPRVAPPLLGLGLLEAVPEQALLDIAQRQSAQGVAGRPNRVWDVGARRTVLGRFGLKANQPGLRQQIASAFLAELGVNSLLFPEENCTPRQIQCTRHPPGGHPEISAERLDAIAFYLRALAVPERRDEDNPTVQRGERLFRQVGCAGCHVPTLATGDYPALPQIAHQIIRPYTDLLLHDMGEGLSDGRRDFEAGARDWRTAPLWGLGLSAAVNGNAFLLHDGRARNLTEAILWHGGQAQRSRDAFARLPAEERAALVAFLHSL